MDRRLLGTDVTLTEHPRERAISFNRRCCRCRCRCCRYTTIQNEKAAERCFFAFLSFWPRAFLRVCFFFFLFLTLRVSCEGLCLAAFFGSFSRVLCLLGVPSRPFVKRRKSLRPIARAPRPGGFEKKNSRAQPERSRGGLTLPFLADLFRKRKKQNKKR